MCGLLVLLFVFSSLFLSTGYRQTYFPAYKLVEFIALTRNAVAPKTRLGDKTYTTSHCVRGATLPVASICRLTVSRPAASIFQCCVTVFCSSISHGQVALCWSHSNCTLYQRRLSGRLRARGPMLSSLLCNGDTHIRSSNASSFSFASHCHPGTAGSVLCICTFFQL